LLTSRHKVRKQIVSIEPLFMTAIAVIGG